MFRILRDVEEDPFLMDPFAAHRQQMRNMFSGFGFSPFFGIPDGRQLAIQDQQRRPVQPTTALSPFGMLGMGGGFLDMFGMMDRMMGNMDQMTNTSPNCQTFSSSTVISYSNMGTGTPKVYQETSHLRTAPGGIRETRRAMRDSESGIERFAVGHHIGERGHVMERARNHRTGDHEERQDFINLDETDADSFNEEWRRETSRYGSHRGIDYQRQRGRRAEGGRLAITGPEDTPPAGQSRRYDW
ncbi:myeloid leukemia factor 2 [Protopterus annectens]|uniref:myeloid leukemia factor 2 n=1 Tax=Protopterus annectens TaxID=7888 RepID=UPI001CF9910F|nr:myeloid leukemia factor 2 [Protopterus annectens]